MPTLDEEMKSAAKCLYMVDNPQQGMIPTPVKYGRRRLVEVHVRDGRNTLISDIPFLKRPVSVVYAHN